VGGRGLPVLGFAEAWRAAHQHQAILAESWPQGYWTKDLLYFRCETLERFKVLPISSAIDALLGINGDVRFQSKQTSAVSSTSHIK
jgi:hypothetical protein